MRDKLQRISARAAGHVAMSFLRRFAGTKSRPARGSNRSELLLFCTQLMNNCQQPGKQPQLAGHTRTSACFESLDIASALVVAKPAIEPERSTSSSSLYANERSAICQAARIGQKTTCKL